MGKNTDMGELLTWDNYGHGRITDMGELLTWENY